MFWGVSGFGVSLDSLSAVVQVYVPILLKVGIRHLSLELTGLWVGDWS